MSRVTNAILTAHVGGTGPNDEIAHVNEFLRARDVGGGAFKECTPHAGGYKHMECRVYLSAFNHAETDLLVEAVEQAPWCDREMVQLFVKEQEEEIFTVRYSGSEAGDKTRVEITAPELLVICNALDEVCNGIQLQDEFETRIGCNLAVARNLLTKLTVAVTAV